MGKNQTVILTHSYKGGSGKTLFSSNVAKVLSDRGKKVLLIESDFSMSAFKAIFDQHKPDIYFNDFLNSSEIDLKPYIYPNYEENFGLIYCDDKVRMGDKVHGRDQNWFIKKKQQIQAALEALDYDFVIFDITPGIQIFAINIISITQEIFLLARPDMQNLKGIRLLLDNVYSKTIKLSGENRSNIRLIFNQTPNIENIDEVINQWGSDLKRQYEFLNEITQLYYEPKTSYETAMGNFLLPRSDPTYQVIDNFVSNHLLS